MTDVAALAGVSHQTVSRVLHDHPNVSARTRTRVRAAITELGYRPNSAARALATGRTQVIGVLSTSSTLYGPASLMNAVAVAAHEAGQAVIVASLTSYDESTLQAGIERLVDQNVGGIVIIAPVEPAARVLSSLSHDVPVITVDGSLSRRGAGVSVDQYSGAYAATTHLLDAGHSTVWHVAGPQDWNDAVGRVYGWRQALIDRGVEPPPLLRAEWSAASGYEAGTMLARIPELTAVFAASDHIALGVLRALALAGRRVPADVSVVGFDDVPESAYFTPALTTVRQDFAEVGRQALRLLLDEVSGGPAPQTPVSISAVLISRDSVGPPPTG